MKALSNYLRALVQEVPITRLEGMAWVLLLLGSAALRFMWLGDRVLSFDESQHAFFSHVFASSGEYQHTPVTHGPFLFHFTALAFKLFGTCDAVARLLPALSGLLTVAIILLWRRWLERAAAFIAGVLAAFSPTLLYFSRYARNDLPMVLFSLGWAYSALRFVETGKRFWLWTLTLNMALAFLSKETAFITGAIFGSFFLGSSFSKAVVAISSKHRQRMRDIAIFMLILVLPFFASFIHLALGWEVTSYSEPEALPRALFSGGVLLALSLALGALYFRMSSTVRRGTWAGSLLLFWVLATLFYSSWLTQLKSGIASGVVGSLGYWITQHEVARGGQPDYYYLFLALIYESLPLLGALIGSGWLLAKQRRKAPFKSPISFPNNAHTTHLFLLWWTLLSFVLYSAAGEKMPWLLTQIAVPMILLGAWGLDRFVRILIRESNRDSSSWLYLILVTPVFFWSTSELMLHRPHTSNQIMLVTDTVAWLGALILSSLLALLICQRLRTAPRSTGLAIGAGLILVVSGQWLHTSFSANFVYQDRAEEFLAYAHGGPEIPRHLSKLESALDLAGVSEKALVQYDPECTWPLSWYLRDFNSSLRPDDSSSLLRPQAEALFAGQSVARSIIREGNHNYVYSRFPLLLWPPETRDVLYPRSTDFGPASFERIRSLLWKRTSIATPFQDRLAFMFLRKDLLPPRRFEEPEVQKFRTIPQALETTVHANYSDASGYSLREPSALAVGPEGELVVADSGNDRVVIYLNTEENFSFGGPCSLFRSEEVECVDPDGNGPLEAGDGQFDEPRGVAVNSQGEIFVADTWNGRIQVFAPDGTFLRKWGRFGSSDTTHPGEPLPLFGPRELRFLKDGTLLVADTGNKRLLRFTQRGELLEQWGSPGNLASLFNEPVGLAVHPQTGDVYVADLWNRRIQQFDGNGNFVRAWPVREWSGQQMHYKAYLAFDGQGRLLATAPETSQVLVFSPQGESLGQLALPRALIHPAGIRFDSHRQRIWIGDVGTGQVFQLRVD